MCGKTGIIIQARMSSSRLPGKSLMKIGEYPLIWYVVKRMEILGLPVVVSTSDSTSDDELVHFLQQERISIFRGSLNNVLDRYIKTAEHFGFTKLIRVTGDNSLVDVHFLKEVLPLYSKFTYVDGIYEGGLIKGCGFEVICLHELQNITSTNKNHQEHVTSWLRTHLHETVYRIRLKPTMVNRHRKDIILTCDYPEDLDLIRKVYQNFNFDFSVSLESVVCFLLNNPYFTNINKGRHNRL